MRSVSVLTSFHEQLGFADRSGTSQRPGWLRTPRTATVVSTSPPEFATSAGTSSSTSTCTSTLVNREARRGRTADRPRGRSVLRRARRVAAATGPARPARSAASGESGNGSTGGASAPSVKRSAEPDRRPGSASNRRHTCRPAASLCSSTRSARTRLAAGARTIWSLSRPDARLSRVSSSLVAAVKGAQRMLRVMVRRPPFSHSAGAPTTKPIAAGLVGIACRTRQTRPHSRRRASARATRPVESRGRSSCGSSGPATIRTVRTVASVAPVTVRSSDVTNVRSRPWVSFPAASARAARNLHGAGLVPAAASKAR